MSMTQKENLEFDIEIKKKQMSLYSISEETREVMFQDYLDEMYGEVNIAGNTYYTSRLFKIIDPIGYAVRMRDFINSFDLTKTKEYKELQEELLDLENEFKELIK